MHTSGDEMRLQRSRIALLVGPEVHRRHVGPESRGVSFQVDNMVGSDVMSCPEAAESLALFSGNGLRADDGCAVWKYNAAIRCEYSRNRRYADAFVVDNTAVAAQQLIRSASFVNSAVMFCSCCWTHLGLWF